LISKKQVHCTHSCTQPDATVPCIKINRISQLKALKTQRFQGFLFVLTPFGVILRPFQVVHR